MYVITYAHYSYDVPFQTIVSGFKLLTLLLATTSVVLISSSVTFYPIDHYEQNLELLLFFDHFHMPHHNNMTSPWAIKYYTMLINTYLRDVAHMRYLEDIGEDNDANIV
mgnify:CR=1 FL=1